MDQETGRLVRNRNEWACVGYRSIARDLYSRVQTRCSALIPDSSLPEFSTTLRLLASMAQAAATGVTMPLEASPSTATL